MSVLTSDRLTLEQMRLTDLADLAAGRAPELDPAVIAAVSPARFA